MTNPNDPAFLEQKPTEAYPNYHTYGLTKREYFAAMAMQGDIANPGEVNPEIRAAHWLRCADALIAELSKEKA